MEEDIWPYPFYKKNAAGDHFCFFFFASCTFSFFLCFHALSKNSSRIRSRNSSSEPYPSSSIPDYYQNPGLTDSTLMKLLVAFISSCVLSFYPASDHQCGKVTALIDRTSTTDFSLYFSLTHRIPSDSFRHRHIRHMFGFMNSPKLSVEIFCHSRI